MTDHPFTLSTVKVSIADGAWQRMNDDDADVILEVITEALEIAVDRMEERLNTAPNGQQFKIELVV